MWRRKYAGLYIFWPQQLPDLRAELKDAVMRLVEVGVDTFYVGNQGRFDAQVRRVLSKLCVRYAVVLAYLPKAANGELGDTMFPEGLELVHPRFAIDRRNRWMLERSEYVVTYVRHGWGGAANFAALAERQGKQIIRL